MATAKRRMEFILQLGSDLNHIVWEDGILSGDADAVELITLTLDVVKGFPVGTSSLFGSHDDDTANNPYRVLSVAESLGTIKTTLLDLGQAELPKNVVS